jgi:hypothetical protein
MTRGGVSDGRGALATGRGFTGGGADTGGGGGTSSTYVFTTDQELSSIDTNQEPYATQHDNLVNGNGESRATTSPTLYTVTDNTNHGYDVHRFVGSKNDPDRLDYNDATAMGAQARDCALAYWFTGNDAFAEAVVDTLATWCVQSSTYMVPEAVIPSKDDNIVGTIRKDVWLADIPYAASFVRGHSRWDNYSSDTPWDSGSVSGNGEDALKQWLRDYHDGYSGSSLTGYSTDSTASHQGQRDDGFCWDNNRVPWWTVTKGAIAAYLEDDALMTEAKQMHTDDVFNACQYQQDTKGARQWGGLNDVNDTEAWLQVEFLRDDDFDYTTFNYYAKSISCQLFEAYDDTDLWTHNADTDSTTNATLKRLVDWSTLRTTMLDTSQWEDPRSNNDGEQTANFEMEQAACLYELAHKRWGEYSNEIDTTEANADGRPNWGKRVLGPVTLVHGGVGSA